MDEPRPSSTVSSAPALQKVAGLYVPQVSAETIAMLQAPPPALANLGLYDDTLLDREITATRARLANSSGPGRAADELNLKALEGERAKRSAALAKEQDATRIPPLMADASIYSIAQLEREIDGANARLAKTPSDESEQRGLEQLQKELAKRLQPLPVDVDFSKSEPQVLEALKTEVTFLSRFGNVVPSEVRLQHEATLAKLQEKHDELFAAEHACDNAKVRTATFPKGANDSYALQFTADDLVAALKSRMPMTANEEQAVRKQFEGWRSEQCIKTGEDPTRIRNEATMHFERDTNGLQQAEMQKRREMLEASAGSVCAALAFVDSAMRGDSVDAAYTRVMGARALSDVAMTMAQSPQAAPAPVIDKPSAVGRVEPFGSPSGTLKTTPMNKMFATEDRPGNSVWGKKQVITYCRTNAERAPYKLEVRKITENGKPAFRMYGADGRPFDTRSAEIISGQSGKAIFVMNTDGEIFASTHQASGEFHHSSLAAGQPVAAAGELVVENGKVMEITNESGHYRPDSTFTDQALAMLRNKGVDLRGVKVKDFTTKTERVIQ